MSMSFEEFLDRGKVSKWSRQEGKLSIKWVTGGVGGGSCWDEGESHHYPRGGSPEPEFTELDELLVNTVPHLTFLTFRELSTSVIKFSEESEYEYYGNSTNYGTRSVDLRELYDFLLAEDLLGD